MNCFVMKLLLCQRKIFEILQMHYFTFSSLLNLIETKFFHSKACVTSVPFLFLFLFQFNSEKKQTSLKVKENIYTVQCLLTYRYHIQQQQQCQENNDNTTEKINVTLNNFFFFLTFTSYNKLKLEPLLSIVFNQLSYRCTKIGRVLRPDDWRLTDKRCMNNS